MTTGPIFGLPGEVKGPTENFDNPTTCASGFGRFFSASGSRLYFSPVFTTIKDLGRCYQKNDPTSDKISDILDTDGGTLKLESTVNIQKLLTYKTGILVFAENGVWYVYNSDGGFSATAYSVSKITSAGIDSPDSVVEAAGEVFYFSNEGIMQITASEFDNLSAVDITQNTIRSYYFENYYGKRAIGAYNDQDKQVFWVVPENSSKFLIMDLVAVAFYPQDCASTTALGKPIKTIDKFYFSYSESIVGFSGSYGVATLDNQEFKDFGVDTTAYLVSGWETLGKFSHKQSVTRARFFFNKTETQVLDSIDGEYIFDKPSACLLQTRWDYDDSDVYAKWVGQTEDFGGKGRKTNVYRPLQRSFFPQEFPADFTTGESLITYTHGIRGRGDAVQFVFEAQPEKDLQLLGYSVNYLMQGRM